MAKVPGLAIAIMSKKKAEEGDEEEGTGKLEDIAEEILTAIKDGNAKDLAESLQSFCDVAMG